MKYITLTEEELLPLKEFKGITKKGTGYGIDTEENLECTVFKTDFGKQYSISSTTTREKDVELYFGLDEDYPKFSYLELLYNQNVVEEKKNKSDRSIFVELIEEAKQGSSEDDKFNNEHDKKVILLMIPIFLEWLHKRDLSKQ